MHGLWSLLGSRIEELEVVGFGAYRIGIAPSLHSETLEKVDHRFHLLHLGGSVGFAERVAVDVGLPLYPWFHDGESGTTH